MLHDYYYDVSCIWSHSSIRYRGRFKTCSLHVNRLHNTPHLLSNDFLCMWQELLQLYTNFNHHRHSSSKGNRRQWMWDIHSFLSCSAWITYQSSSSFNTSVEPSTVTVEPQCVLRIFIFQSINCLLTTLHTFCHARNSGLIDNDYRCILYSCSFMRIVM